MMKRPCMSKMFVTLSRPYPQEVPLISTIRRQIILPLKAAIREPPDRYESVRIDRISKESHGMELLRSQDGARRAIIGPQTPHNLSAAIQGTTGRSRCRKRDGLIACNAHSKPVPSMHDGDPSLDVHGGSKCLLHLHDQASRVNKVMDAQQILTRAAAKIAASGS